MSWSQVLANSDKQVTALSGERVRLPFAEKICRVFYGKFGGMAEKCYLCSAKSLEKILPFSKNSLEKILKIA